MVVRMIVHRVFAEDQGGDQGGPASLVGCAEAGAGFALEVFVEEPPVAEMGVLLARSYAGGL